MNRSHRSAGLGLLLGGILVGPASSASAVTRPYEEAASIEGVIRQHDGSVVPKATVTLRCVGLPDPRVAKTDARGRYAFSDVLPDLCSLHVTYEDDFFIKDLRVLRGVRLREDIEFDRPITYEEFKAIPVYPGLKGRDVMYVVGPPGSAVAIRPPETGSSNNNRSPFVPVSDAPRSAFSSRVGTSSSAFVQQSIARRVLPRPHDVRIDALVNDFDYDDVSKPDRPVTVNWEIAVCPWNREHLLARVGLQAASAPPGPLRNLVFAVDAMSLSSAHALPRLQATMRTLANHLGPRDRVSIVVHGGGDRVVLEPTRGDDLPSIRNAIAELDSAVGSKGASGIPLAYRLARKSFVRGGLNRVLLVSSRGFDADATADGALRELIESQGRLGVSMAVLDSEADTALLEAAGTTLTTVARAVQPQVHFNPAKVQSYRLLGYRSHHEANRYADDMVAGQGVTALYELIPVTDDPKPTSKHRRRRRRPSAAPSQPWMTAVVRYKHPKTDGFRRLVVPMSGRPLSVKASSDDLRFSAALATFGLVLGADEAPGHASLQMARALAVGSRGEDRRGARAAFMELVAAAEELLAARP